MRGTMMDYPLTLNSILERAGKFFPEVEIVSLCPAHRYTYRDFHRRALALCAGLRKVGLKPGERVATLIWNRSQHLECYFGIPAAGGVLHTLNLRLHPDELSYIINHAEDRFIIVDDVLLPLLEQCKDIKPERVFVASSGAAPQACESYEEFIASPASDDFQPVPLEEDA